MLSSSFLFTEAFLTLAKKNFDTVLFEKDMTDEKYTLQAILLHHLDHAKNILLVLEKTSLEYILPLTSQKHQANITIINPSAGILGFANTGFWDTSDIAKSMVFDFEVLEPISQEELLMLLKTPANKRYIRISEHTSMQEFLPQLNYTDGNDTLITFQPHGFSGIHGTIVGLGMCSVDILHAGVILQDQGKSMDIFISQSAQISFCMQLKESIQRTEKLIVIVDQHPGSLYEAYIKSRLWEIGLIETEVVFITPKYSAITTVMPEYMYEQTEFDGAHIAQRILSS